MDEKQIQFLFDNYAKGKGFKDINEFRSLMGDEGSRKIFFDDSNKELGFKDYNDFEETIGVKKKPSSNNGATPLEAGSSVTPNLETEIPLVDIGAARPEDNTFQGNTPGEDDIIGQAQYADELRKRTKTVAGRTMPDEEAAVYAGSVEKGLEAKGYDAKKIAQDFTGIPDYAFNVKGLSKPELLEKYKSNKPQYERNIATAKAQSALRDELYKLPNGRQLWADVVSSYNAAGVGDAAQQRENLRRIVSVANSYGGEKSDEIVKNLGIDFSNLYGKESLDVANIEKDPKSAVLNNIQLGAWHLLEDTKPNELNKYKAALLDDKDIKDNPEAKLQKQEAGRQLELLGATLQKSYAQEKLNPILKEYTALSDKAAKEGLTPIEQQRMVQLEQDGKPFADIIQQVNDNESTLTSRYPMSSYLDANNFAQELVGQKHTGLGWLAAETGKATENTAKGIWDIVSEPFRSDENSNLHQAEILGSSNLSQNSAYLKQENQLQKSFKPELSEELQKDIDAIKNDPSLSDSQKLSKASDLLMSRAGEWRRSPVENGETNIGLTSLMYGVGGLAANLAPFVLGDLVTGGGVNAGALKKFSSMFTSAAATSFHDAYVDALKRGEENPFAHAARVTAINSAALAGADAPAAIRKMIGGETAIGKLVSKMTDDEIAAALKESPKALTAFGKSLDAIKKTGGQIANTSLQSFKSGAKIAGITTAGQAVNDAIDKELKSPIDYAKQAAIETLKFGVGGTMAGIAGRAISKPTEMNLAAISEAGKNPEPFLMSLETMEKNGSISPEQAQQVRTNIEKANKIFKSSPILNNPDITDKVKREYLYNTWAKKEIQESLPELPPKMAEKAEKYAMVLDHKNELLLHPPTDKQLGSQQSALEKKLEPKKDAEGKVEVLPEKEKASLEAELEAVKQTIEARKKEVPETPKEESGITVQEPMNIPEPTTIKVENEPIKEPASSTTVSSEVKSSGVGGDVETTTNVLNETQKNNPTVWQKIKDAFYNLVSKTKEYLNKAKGTQYEELAKVLGDHLKNVRTSTIEDLKGVLGEKIGGQLQKLHILVNSGKGDLQIFFHEAMHHITFEKINQYLNNNHENLKPHEIDAIQNLQRIFTDSKAKIEAMKVKTSFHYGFTNLHEFISEAFSNPEFQRLLKELPSEGKHPTVFKAFLDAIAKLMGLKDATILNDIFHHTEKLLDKPKSENEGIAELYHQAKAEGTHSDFVKAVEQSIPTQEVKMEQPTVSEKNKTIQNEPIKEGAESTQPIPTEEVKPTEASPVESGSGAGKEPPKESTGIGATESNDIGGITQAANEVRRQDRMMPEFQKNPQSFEQWNNEAEKLIKEGYDVDKLMDRLEKGDDATPVENAIRKIYIATLDAEIAKNPTNELLAKQKRFIEIGDAANRLTGQKLVSLKGQGNPLSTISDFYVAKMEAVGSDTLTESQKAEVKGDYDRIKKERDAFEAKAKEAQDAFRLMQAENELLKQKKGGGAKSPKTTSTGKRDFAAERQSLKEKLKQQVADYKAAGQKVGISSDGGLESFVISAKIAKTITEIAKSHVDEIGVKIKDVAKKTLEDVREFFGDKVTEEDIMDVLAGKYNEKRETQNELAAKMRELKTEANLLQEYKRLLEGGEPKDEKKAIKRNQRLTELRNEIKGLENLDKEVEGIRDAELKVKADKNKETIEKLDKLEKEDKAAAAKYRRELEAENAKELQRLKEEFDKKLRENERKNKEDAADLQRKLKEQANEKQRQMDKEAAEFNKKLRDEELKRKQDAADLQRKLKEQANEKQWQMDKEAAEFNKKLRDEELKRKQDEIDLAKELKRKLEYKTPAERVAAQAIEKNRKAEQKIRERIASKDFEPKPKAKSFMESPEFKQRHSKLFNEVLDSSNKKDAAQLEFERKLLEEEMKHWGTAEKVRAGITKTSGTLKHLFASFDASAIAVQNLPLIVTNPVIGAKGIAFSFKNFASQKVFDRYLAELHNSPDWHIIKECIRVTEPKSLLEAGREEYFPDRFKAVVKIKGKEYGWVKTKSSNKYELLDISKPFERQFTSLGNALRVIKFRTEMEKLYEKGITYEKNPEEFKTLGRRLDNLSSSADIPEAYQNQLTKTLIWSTRLIAAKLNMLGISDIAAMIPGTGVKKGYYKSLGIKGQKLSRQQWEATKDLATFASGVMAMTYLYALATGGKVNTDMDSNGFLDVEKNGKSVNFSGGFSRYISMLIQMKKGGKRDKLGTFREYAGTDVVKEGMSFFGSKAPPLTRSTLNILAGKDPGGRDADIATEVSKYKMPLAIGQIYEQVEKDGYGSLFSDGLMTFIGFNTKDDRDYKSHTFSQDTKDFIEKNQIKIDFPKNQYIKDGEEAKMDDETYKKYVAAVDERIEHAIGELKDNKSTLVGDMQEAMKEIVSEAVSDTQFEMFGDEPKNVKPPSFIKGHKPLPIKKKTR